MFRIARFLFNSYFMRGGEWFLTIVTFWMRPLYRKMIKTKMGRKIAFLLGDPLRDSIAAKTAFCCFIFCGIISIALSEIVCQILIFTVEERLCSFFLKFDMILELLIVCLYTLYIGNRIGDHWHILSEEEDTCLLFDNPDDFCKYHDGYFRKEKLVYRIYQEKTRHIQK